MNRLAPLEDGDLCALAPDTVRRYVASGMRIIAETGAEFGIVSEQYVLLVTGAPIVLSVEQLRAFVPVAKRPSDEELEAYEAWKLEGDDALSPA